MNSLINRALQRALGKQEDDNPIDLEVKFELPSNYEESLKIVADKLSPKLGESAQNLAEDFDDLVNDNPLT